jgi:cytochrome c oxidase assembly protein subunit 15
MTASTAETTARAPARADNQRAVAIWLLACCAMIFAMVVIGGITRLTWSGLSITEWQPVSGIVPPLSAADWQAEFAKYQQSSQYRLLNAGMSLGNFKTIYLWEYAHRLWGRLIGVAYLLPFLYFLVRGQIPRRLACPLAGIFALGGCQGALGWYMVESGLADQIEVSQYRLTAHLALALVIYAATLWTALGLLYPASGNAPALWRRAGEAVLGLVGLTIVAGGFVAGLNAGLIYNTFPGMGDGFVPPDYAQLSPFFRNWFENPAAAQFDHRLLAMTAAYAVIILWLAALRIQILPQAARRMPLPRGALWAVHSLFAALVLQVSLGVSTLLLVVPVPLAAAHQAGAVLLLTAALVLRHTLRPPQENR